MKRTAILLIMNSHDSEPTPGRLTIDDLRFKIDYQTKPRRTKYEYSRINLGLAERNAGIKKKIKEQDLPDFENPEGLKRR